jgi:hypothetical protein
MTLSHEWPDLSGLELRPTIETLHLWSQIVGKIRLMMTPFNHGWQVPLYVSVSGLTTGLIPAGQSGFSLEFDLIGDELAIRDTDGKYGKVPLRRQSVAEFYAATMGTLGAMGIEVQLDPMPCEIADAVRFHDDHIVRTYDGEAARAYWRALVQTHRVLQVFRSRFSPSAVRSIFSGEASISRLPGSRAAPRRAIPAALCTCRTPWRAKPTARRFRAPGFGRAAVGSKHRASTATHIQRRPAFPTQASDRRPPDMTPIWGSFCFLTTRYPPVPIRMATF